MSKKILPVLMLAIMCAFSTTAFERSTTTTVITTCSSKVFAGIYAASVWNSNNARWNRKAAHWTSAGAVIGGACMKAALAGSGIGPAGSIICGAAVGL